MGDPGGIGPEVIVKALDPRRRRACPGVRFVILAAESAMNAAAGRARVPRFWSLCPPGVPWPKGDVLMDYEERPPRSGYAAKPTALGGDMSFRCFSDAVMLALHGSHTGVSAVVTGPISKKAWELAGHGEFPGHTEALARLCAVKQCAMFFHAPPSANGPGLNVILATVHVPLARVPGLLTRERIEDVISLGHKTMRQLGSPRPRIAVCGLNPHAGEDGLLGDDEARVIEPALRASRRRGIRCAGPFPADTLFQRALSTRTKPAEFDLIVAMYHDQGLIPLKTLAWDRAVNLTAGLPIIRTSPDHGTAFDIAGTNRADAGSMRAAVDTAIRLARAGLETGSTKF